ncbi:GNAT family N-acetyltransferase [Sphingomonas sp. MAH-20]|jgi:predicted GNAT family acetyltransferase|uniref:GNAT family N-acetyltransferase n=1 Tax=Sphingomonas horti TaxID=2682842 RepID=A0A6I4J2D0_9SPHN|nr:MULTISPECIES: GNAT family N-acetyltransferase [Sphingomonas]MBA2919574.1 N-acetyltransferase [Sphingomonas sp. CGMCC 1.13658]MVO78454.1 GNAT family N-acetyltransferase [Sphingomonas horti]
MNKPDSAQVLHDPGKHRFELPIEGEAIAAAYYRRDDEGRFVLTHTEVPSEYEGRGLGSALARGVFEIARAQGFRLVLRCPFMQRWSARHPEFGDVVDG